MGWSRGQCWSKEKVEAKLRALLPQFGGMPTHEELCSIGEGGLGRQVNRRGGYRHWRKRLGVETRRFHRICKKSMVQRFWEKVDKTATCWLWRGAINRNGYGNFLAGGTRADGLRYQEAHIVSYELHRGPIPDGLELDHLCRVHHCVNPDHLEPVTHTVNMRRAVPFRRKKVA